MIRYAYTFIYLLCFLLVACGQESDQVNVEDGRKDKEIQKQDTGMIVLGGDAFGTSYQIKYFLPIQLVNNSQELKSFQSHLLKSIAIELRIVNDTFSTYEEDSEINKVNSHQAGQPIVVSFDFMHLVALSEQVHDHSSGLFDIGVGALVAKKGFGSNLLLTGHFNNTGDYVTRPVINLAEQTIIRPKNFVLDMSAIAKGYAVDRIAALLERQGVMRYMVEIGGEIKVGAPKAADSKWNVAIELPSINLMASDSIYKVLALSNKAMATSGNYRNFSLEQGHWQDHFVKTKDMDSLENEFRLISATVLADSCAEADAWATALMVADLEKAKELIKANKLEAVLLYADDANFMKTLQSKPSEALMKIKEYSSIKAL